MTHAFGLANSIGYIVGWKVDDPTATVNLVTSSHMNHHKLKRGKCPKRLQLNRSQVSMPYLALPACSRLSRLHDTSAFG
jgi:hypothetical protein